MGRRKRLSSAVRGTAAIASRVDDLCNVIGTAVNANGGAGGRVQFEPELRSDHHAVAQRGKRLAYERLVRERAISFRGIEEGDAPFDGGAEAP